MKRKEVAAILDDIAQMLELKGESAFRVRAYQAAAQAIRGQEEELTDLAARGALGSIPGLGKSTTGVVTQLLKEGRSQLYETLRAEFPEGVLELLRLPGLGPKKVRTIWRELGVESIGELEYACNENRLILLSGFGEKTQKKVLDAIAFYKKTRDLCLYADALGVAERVCAALRGHPAARKVALAGQLRRQCPVVGEIELVATGDAPALLDAFLQAPGVREVLERSEDRAFLRLEEGLGCRLRVCPEERFGAVLAVRTGADAHLQALCSYARERGFSLTEDGLFSQGEPVPCPDEEALFSALGLPLIPPPLREGMGEVEAAAQGTLPNLITRAQIRGVIHNHTTWSDGAASLEAMVRQAEAQGYEYIQISDHSKSAHYAGGLDEKRLLAQGEAIDDLQAKCPHIKILKGSEVDILADGSLDFPPEVLARLDLVIASVHTRFREDREEMTRRLVRAVENPYVDVLGHPTGRLLLAREPYAVDMERVLLAAAKAGTAIEINANPRRLDLDWTWMKRAKELGVMLCIAPDAHSVEGLEHVSFGVYAAQKGWVEAQDVLNTLNVKDFLAARKRR